MATTIYYLSQLIGKPVLDPHGRPVGRLGDLVVRLGGPFPPVMGLTLRLGSMVRGASPLATFMPWRQVASVGLEGLTLSSTRLDLQAFARRPGELLLEVDLLDQQVIDLHGRKLVRVNDVQLVAAGPEGIDLRLAGIDVGVQGLLRRLELGQLADWLGSHTPLQIPDRVIPWEGIEPVDLSDLPAEMTGGVAYTEKASNGTVSLVARGLQLNHDRLAALHPADVAELVSQLSAPDRAAILESLDTEMAAEALGELSTEMRADVLEDLPANTAAEIFAELPPDEAADTLAEVSTQRADELLRGLEADDALAVRRLMSYDPETAGGMMTTTYVAVDAQLTAQETIEKLRELSPPAEEVYYIYVVDAGCKLIGVLSLRDLIVARPQTPVSEIISGYGEVVKVPVDASEEDVIHVIDKYNLLAVPVTDEANRLVGVITVDDALAAALPEERGILSRIRR